MAKNGSSKFLPGAEMIASQLCGYPTIKAFYLLLLSWKI